MALAVAEFVSASIDSGDTITLPSWTPAANDLVLVGAYYSVQPDYPLDATKLSGNGLTFDLVASELEDGISYYYAYLFRAMSASPSSGAITIDTTDNVMPANVIAVRISGAATGSNGANAVEATATAVEYSGNDDMLGSVTTVSANAWALAFGGHGTVGLTLPGGETGIVLNEASSGTRASMWYQPVSSPGATQLGASGDLGLPGATWVMVMAAIQEALVPFVPSAATPRAIARFFDPHTGRPLRDIVAWQ